MIDKILENYSKSVESTLKLQQEMLRNWTTQWSPLGTQVFGLPKTGTSTSASAAPARQSPAATWLEQLSTAQKKWAEAVADMLKRHQETLDEQYRAGIPLSMMRSGSARPEIPSSSAA